MTGCPPAGRWLESFLRPIDAETRAALTAHQRTCERCARTFALFRSLGRTDRDEPVPDPVPEGCAGDESLAALADPAAPVPPAEILDHVAGCAPCLVRLDRRLADIRRDRVAELEPRPAKRKWWNRFRR